MEDVKQPPTLPRYKTREKYRVVKQISKGSYGDVFLAERVDDGQLVCLKQVDLDFLSPSERAGCLSEVRLLQSLPPHQNVVKCHDGFWGDTSECGGGSRLVLVLEYGDAGDLETLIQAEPLHQSELWVETALNIFAQITSGLAFLHQQHVLHRDIKSKNVFRFSDGRVVIGDFGTCKSLAHTAALANTLVGSPLYMSPELLDDQPYSFSSDIWSLGCLVYELFVGRTPFVAASYPAVVFKITKGVYDPLPPTLPAEVQDAVARMLSLDPSQRPTAEELLQMGIVKSRLCEAKTPEDAPDVTDTLTAVATMVMSSPSDNISDVRVDVETVESPGNELMLLPPPPPSALSAAVITAQACGSHAPLPQPPASNAQRKTRKDGPQVFPTTRASIADILSKERLNVHKERAHTNKTQSGGAKFLSCIPVTERTPAPRIRRAPKTMASTAPANRNTRAPVPPENMLIIGTKVISVKPTKPVVAKR